jgi:outer membrane protein assembly factor BamB
LFFLTSAHGGPKSLYAVRADARGDVTPNDSGGPSGLAWWHKRYGSYMPTPIVYGDNIYVCDDGGALTVMDAKTGEKHYRKRLASSRASNYTASAVAAGDRIYFASEDGDVHVIQAGNEYNLLASNSMNETCMATPAIAQGRLFIRTRGNLYCIGQ